MTLEPDKTEIGGGIRIVEQCRLEVLESTRVRQGEKALDRSHGKSRLCSV
jgi:hypothetical protein